MLSNSSSYTERIDQNFCRASLYFLYSKILSASGVRQGRKVVILKEKHQDSNLERNERCQNQKLLPFAAFLAKLRSRNSPHGDRSIFLRLGATFLYRDPWRVHRGDSYPSLKQALGGGKRKN